MKRRPGIGRRLAQGSREGQRDGAKSRHYPEPVRPEALENRPAGKCKQAVTLMGSYNWTSGAAANSENLNLVSSPAVAAAYAAHWRNRLAVSVRFERRED